jgi:hypothetical protein
MLCETHRRGQPAGGPAGAAPGGVSWHPLPAHVPSSFREGSAPARAGILESRDVYDKDNFLVANFGRYSNGSTTDELKKDSDDSLTISIQKYRPGDLELAARSERTLNMTIRLGFPTAPTGNGCGDPISTVQ